MSSQPNAPAPLSSSGSSHAAAPSHAAVPSGSPATQHQLARLMQKVSRAFRDAGVKLEPPAPRK